MPVYILSKSKRKGKRLMLMKDKPIHFGSDVGQTFIDHGDEKKKKAWEARHKGDKGYNDKDAGIYYSRHILWGDHDNIFANINALNKKDGIHIKMVK